MTRPRLVYVGDDTYWIFDIGHPDGVRLDYQFAGEQEYTTLYQRPRGDGSIYHTIVNINNGKTNELIRQVEEKVVKYNEYQQSLGAGKPSDSGTEWDLCDTKSFVLLALFFAVYKDDEGNNGNEIAKKWLEDRYFLLQSLDLFDFADACPILYCYRKELEGRCQETAARTAAIGTSSSSTVSIAGAATAAIAPLSAHSATVEAKLPSETGRGASDTLNDLIEVDLDNTLTFSSGDTTEIIYFSVKKQQFFCQLNPEKKEYSPIDLSPNINYCDVANGVVTCWNMVICQEVVLTKTAEQLKKWAPMLIFLAKRGHEKAIHALMRCQQKIERENRARKRGELRYNPFTDIFERISLTKLLSLPLYSFYSSYQFWSKQVEDSSIDINDHVLADYLVAEVRGLISLYVSYEKNRHSGLKPHVALQHVSDKLKGMLLSVVFLATRGHIKAQAYLKKHYPYFQSRDFFEGEGFDRSAIKAYLKTLEKLDEHKREYKIPVGAAAGAAISRVAAATAAVSAVPARSIVTATVAATSSVTTTVSIPAATSAFSAATAFSSTATVVAATAATATSATPTTATAATATPTPATATPTTATARPIDINVDTRANEIVARWRKLMLDHIILPDEEEELMRLAPEMFRLACDGHGVARELLVLCYQKIQKEVTQEESRYKKFTVIFKDIPLVDKMGEFSMPLPPSLSSLLTAAASRPDQIDAFFARITPSIFGDAKQGNFAPPPLLSYDRAWLITMREWLPDERNKLFSIRGRLVKRFCSRMEELRHSVDSQKLLEFLKNKDRQFNVFFNLMSLHRNPDDQRRYDAERELKTSSLGTVDKVIEETIAKIVAAERVGLEDDTELSELSRPKP